MDYWCEPKADVLPMLSSLGVSFLGVSGLWLQPPCADGPDASGAWFSWRCWPWQREQRTPCGRPGGERPLTRLSPQRRDDLWRPRALWSWAPNARNDPN